MRRQKHFTAQEACELIFNHVVEKNDQDDNADQNEEEESHHEEDSGSGEGENKYELIDPTYRPHATSAPAPPRPGAPPPKGVGANSALNLLFLSFSMTRKLVNAWEA